VAVEAWGLHSLPLTQDAELDGLLQDQANLRRAAVKQLANKAKPTPADTQPVQDFVLDSLANAFAAQVGDDEALDADAALLAEPTLPRPVRAADALALPAHSLPDRAAVAAPDAGLPVDKDEALPAAPTLPSNCLPARAAEAPALPAHAAVAAPDEALPADKDEAQPAAPILPSNEAPATPAHSLPDEAAVAAPDEALPADKDEAQPAVPILHALPAEAPAMPGQPLPAGAAVATLPAKAAKGESAYSRELKAWCESGKTRKEWLVSEARRVALEGMSTQEKKRRRFF